MELKERYQWGKMYGGGGYVRISYYLCAIKILFLHNNRTTADMLCPVMDGAYFIEWCVLWDTGHEFFISEQGSAVTFFQRTITIFAPKNGWQYDRKRKLPVWRGVCKGYRPLGIDGTTSQGYMYWFGAYNGCTWICKDKYPGNKLILSQSFIQFSHHPVIQAQGFCGRYPIADCFYHASITGSLTYPLPLFSHDNIFPIINPISCPVSDDRMRVFCMISFAYFIWIS